MYPTTAPAAPRPICCDKNLLSPSQTPFKFKKPRSTDALNALKVQWQSEVTTNGSPAAAGHVTSRGGETHMHYISQNSYTDITDNSRFRSSEPTVNKLGTYIRSFALLSVQGVY